MSRKMPKQVCFNNVEEIWQKILKYSFLLKSSEGHNLIFLESMFLSSLLCN